MRIIYSCVIYLLAPLLIIRLCWVSFRNPDYRGRWAERFGFPDKIVPDGKIIWIHAVSVGEVQAARPLVGELMKEYPNCKILITTMTPSGRQSVEKSFAAAVQHLYIPYDFPISVKHFIATIAPSILIVMETELWPNLFHYCRKNDIPVVLVNARMSQKSAEGYKRLTVLTKSMLENTSLIIAQGKNDAARLIALGSAKEKVHVTGNIKFDIHLPDVRTEKVQALKIRLAANRPVWVAASTHEGEEDIVLDAFEKILQRYPHCLLVIVPRHPARAASVKTLCRRRNFPVLCKSEGQECDKNIPIFILDTLGELPQYYAIADVAFVGGSLAKIGGHNMLEPASLGIPVITGPHVFNFHEVSQLLLNCGAAWSVLNADELSGRVTSLLDDASLRQSMGEQGKAVVVSNLDNVRVVMKLTHDIFQSYLS